MKPLAGESPTPTGADDRGDHQSATQTATLFRMLKIRALVRFLRCSIGLLLLLALAGCGSSPERSPTPVSATITPAVSPAASMTVGQIADAIADAWQQVQTIRITREFTPVVTPSATPFVTRLVLERDAAGNAHVVITDSAGATGELRAVDGVVLAHGPLVLVQIDPGLVDETGWIPVDRTLMADNPVIGPLLQTVLTPIPPVYSGLSESRRERQVEQLGEQVIDGRNCQAVRIPATTATGQIYDVILTLDASNLPCAIETVGIGSRTVEIFTFNDVLPIAMPIASPSATPV